ncbi:ribokinase [Shewanella violacea]|uniref:Ribokinase n=1 Tax=Shewanella violacea (strain JCM 10179 / CIP 106290 / LMG 19151 / DSS12) TaxID=637905 RepID=D4ZG07_SHEVD|nr:ribokinase [Shewanella violacea]BAJ00606.1 ribokinase [Shewanella violacea DSS12]
MAKLSVLGSINVDHLMQVGAAPRGGQTIQAKQYQIVAGGKGANQAVAAAKLGADVAMIACIGTDAIGEQMKQGLADIGIDTKGITTITGENTGVAMIYVEDSGENRIGIWPGANASLTETVMSEHKASIQDSDLLLLQLETPVETLVAAAKIAKAAGTRVVLNPAPAKALPEALLSNVDIITPNETEAEQLTGVAISELSDADMAANKLHTKFGIETVLITLGERGVWLSHKGEGKHIAGFVMQAIDTTAAGDTFNGGFVTGLLEGQSMLDSVRFGQAAAALSVTRMGAQSSIPTRVETLALLA